MEQDFADSCERASVIDSTLNICQNNRLTRTCERMQDGAMQAVDDALDGHLRIHGDLRDRQEGSLIQLHTFVIVNIIVRAGSPVALDTVAAVALAIQLF